MQGTQLELTKAQFYPLTRVLKSHTTKLLYSALEELVTNAPASKTCFKFIDLNIDKSLYGYLFKSIENVKLSPDTVKLIEETLWTNQELIQHIEVVLDEKLSGILHISDRSCSIEQVELHSTLYNGLNRLARAIHGSKSRTVIDALERIKGKSLLKQNTKAATVIIYHYLNRMKLKAFCRTFYPLASKRSKEPVGEAGFEKLERFINKKTDSNTMAGLNKIRILSKMRYLYMKRYGHEGDNRNERSVHMIRYFDDKPQLYTSVVSNNPDSKKILLLLRTLTDIISTNKKEKYNWALFNGLKHKSQKFHSAKSLASKLGKTVERLRLKGLGQAFLFLKYTKQTLMNFKFSLLIIHILHHNKKRYYFKQFHYLVSQLKKPVDLAIAKTKPLTFTSNKKKEPSKLLAAVDKAYRHRIMAAVTMLRMFQKPKPQSKPNKVVYGKVVTLKVPNNPSSYRPSMRNLGSQDFENGNGRLRRVLR